MPAKPQDTPKGFVPFTFHCADAAQRRYPHDGVTVEHDELTGEWRVRETVRGVTTERVSRMEGKETHDGA